MKTSQVTHTHGHRQNHKTVLSLTCDLGFDLPLHLQRVYEDAAVADETGAGDAPVGLAEALLVKIIPRQRKEN